MRTPIYPPQYARAHRLLTAANTALASLVDERLNLDTETRDAINEARTALSEAERLLLDQPIAQ